LHAQSFNVCNWLELTEKLLEGDDFSLVFARLEDLDFAIV
jgi:hypothetical protein